MQGRMRVQDAEAIGEGALVAKETSAVAQRREPPAGHINFWQQDELRMGNHEKKVRTLLDVSPSSHSSSSCAHCSGTELSKCIPQPTWTRLGCWCVAHSS